jgi:diguanylate cyclase (GGDEF)-like protein
VPAYAEAPVGRQCAIGAYIGVPLVYEGELFGTLCAIDPNPQPENITAEQSMIELIASLLSSLLSSELKTLEANREAERAQAESFRDPVTQLYNRRGWEHFLALEEDRCQRYANPTCIFYVDLNGLKQVNDTYGHAAGDELIQRAAATLQSVARSQDIVARLGGDEFALLAVECDAISAVVLRERLDAALVNAQLSASVGMAQRDPARGLAHAFEEADKAMYCEKQRHRLTQKML